MSQPSTLLEEAASGLVVVVTPSFKGPQLSWSLDFHQRGNRTNPAPGPRVKKRRDAEKRLLEMCKAIDVDQDGFFPALLLLLLIPGQHFWYMQPATNLLSGPSVSVSGGGGAAVAEIMSIHLS